MLELAVSVVASPAADEAFSPVAELLVGLRGTTAA